MCYSWQGCYELCLGVKSRMLNLNLMVHLSQFSNNLHHDVEFSSHTRVFVVSSARPGEGKVSEFHPRTRASWNKIGFMIFWEITCGSRVGVENLPAIAWNQQRVQESVFSCFEGRYTIPRLKVHKIDVHSIARQANEVLRIMKSKVGHFLVHHTLQCDLKTCISKYVNWTRLILHDGHLKFAFVEVENTNFTLA